MTIEIRELIIRATVVASSGTATLPGAQLQKIKQDIVRECLERVLEQLEHIDNISASHR